MLTNNIKKLLVIVTLTFSSSLFAHGDEDHNENDKEASYSNFSQETLSEINEAYTKDVKPIFEKACNDCHSNKTKYPWYYKIPGVRQYIDHDIKEAREHLDFSTDYPFKSHESPIEDLEEIIETIKEGEMPPLQYSIFHPSARLNKEEKQLIINWAKSSLEKLK